MWRTAASIVAIGLLLLSGIGGWIEHGHTFDLPTKENLCVVDHAGQVGGSTAPQGAGFKPDVDAGRAQASNLTTGGRQHEHQCLACQLNRPRVATPVVVVVAIRLPVESLLGRAEVASPSVLALQAHLARGPPAS